MSNKFLRIVLAIGATWFAESGSTLHAAVIPNVSISAVSSEFTNGVTDRRRATNLVFSTGLFGDFHTAAPQGNMWLTSPTTTGAYTNAFVTFDLGSVHTLSAMKVWNYNEVAASTQRGIQLAHISTAEPLRVGSRDDFVTRTRGDIAEIILIRGALSVAERNAIESYLGTKYGIQIAPPLASVSLNAKLSGTNIALSWPIPTSNAPLENSTDFASWTTVTNAAVITGMTNNVSLAATNAQRFYRLHGQ